MSAWKMCIELFFIGVLIYGFYKENEIIKFEDDLKRIIKGNWRRFKRLHLKSKSRNK